MLMDVFSPLSAEDEFSFISHTNQMVLHGVTQQPGERGEGNQATEVLITFISMNCLHFKNMVHELLTTAEDRCLEYLQHLLNTVMTHREREQP